MGWSSGSPRGREQLRAPTAEHEPPRADLIQCYDEYVMGYSKTRGYLGGAAPAALSSTVPQHVLLLDGKMAGNWKHALKPGSAELGSSRCARSAPRSGAP